MSRIARGLLAAVLVGLLTTGCSGWHGTQPGPSAESADRTGLPAAGISFPDRTIDSRPARQAATTAHPIATRVALAMLARGGAPIDAAIAAQMVLGLVEPQSSGIGGGSLVLHWDAGAESLSSYDGLAAAPARVTASLRTDTDGRLLDAGESQRGGRSVGIPGTLPVLKLAHERHGRLPWPVLFEPAIRLAREGYPMAPYVHAVLSQPGAASLHADWLDSHFDADRRPLAPGTMITNPAYARTLSRIAARGPSALYDDDGMGAVLAALQRGHRPSLISEQDLRGYRPVERDPVCAAFLRYRVCTTAPPSFGGIAVLQILQIVQASTQGAYDFADPLFVHRFAEAGKLAQADRLLWVGDPDFFHVPVQALTAASYARDRARLIDDNKANNTPPAGEPATRIAMLAPDEASAAPGTSQIAVADGEGNAVTITSTINLNFGARLAAAGFVLNNAMTNFSAAPRPGQLIANSMQAGKRPITSMAPVIVFDALGQVVLVGGSAGGGQIVDYIAQALIDMLANDQHPAQALARGHVSSALRPRVQLESGSRTADLAQALRAKGHLVEVAPMISGLGFLKRVSGGWLGAADPRRDGVALGRQRVDR